MPKLRLIYESIDRRMPIIVQTIDSINRKLKKKSKGRIEFSPPLFRLMKQNDLATPEDLVRWLNQFDPTGDQAKYTQYIVKIMSENQLRLPEDGERLTKTLSVFDDSKKSGRFKMNKDINFYKKFRDLEGPMLEIIKKMDVEGGEEAVPASLRKWRKWIKSPQTGAFEMFYKDQLYTLLRFENTGQTIDIYSAKTKTDKKGKTIETEWIPFEYAKPEENATPVTLDVTAVALSKLACGTSYCVANPRTAASYLSGGPLFALYKQGELYTLADTSWSEFRDQADVSLADMSPHLALFFTKVIVKKHEEMTPAALRTLSYKIKDMMGNRLSEFASKRPKVHAAMEKAMEIAASKQNNSF